MKYARFIGRTRLSSVLIYEKIQDARQGNKKFLMPYSRGRLYSENKFIDPDADMGFASYFSSSLRLY